MSHKMEGSIVHLKKSNCIVPHTQLMLIFSHPRTHKKIATLYGTTLYECIAQRKTTKVVIHC